MEDKTYKCYELIIGENDETMISFISEVTEPAIEIDYVAFSKSGEIQKFDFKVANEAKRMLTGIFMRPNLPIKRIDKKTNEEYYVKYSPESVENARNKFMRDGLTNQIDTQHDNKINGNYVCDTWIIRDVDSNPIKCFGFTDVQVGDWVGTIHVKNEEHWDEYIKTGILRGFSVQGNFQLGPAEELKFNKDFFEDLTEQENEQINFIIDLLFDEEE